MYQKPCDTMTEREYYNSERHCILVAPGDPAPRSMLVCLPMIQRAQVIGQRLKACQADFLEVAKTCVPVIYCNTTYFNCVLRLHDVADVELLDLSARSNSVYLHLDSTALRPLEKIFT